jgi:hypothetical protein
MPYPLNGYQSSLSNDQIKKRLTVTDIVQGLVKKMSAWNWRLSDERLKTKELEPGFGRRLDISMYVSIDLQSYSSLVTAFTE